MFHHTRIGPYTSYYHVLRVVYGCTQFGLIWYDYTAHVPMWYALTYAIIRADVVYHCNDTRGRVACGVQCHTCRHMHIIPHVHTLYHCNDHCTSYRHWLHFSMTFNVFGNIHCATRHCNDHCNIRVVYVIKYWSIFVVLMRVWYEYRTKTRQKYQYSSFFIIFRVMRKKRCIIKTKTDETNGHKSIIS